MLAPSGVNHRQWCSLPRWLVLPQPWGLAILWASKFLCGKNSSLSWWRTSGKTAQYVVCTLSHLQCWCPLNMAGPYLSGLSVMHSAYFCKLRTEYHRPIADVNMLQLWGGGRIPLHRTHSGTLPSGPHKIPSPDFPMLTPHLKSSTSSTGAPAICFFLNYTYSQICLVS